MAFPDKAPVLPARLLADASVLPDRVELLARLPRDAVFVEVGVGFGDFTEHVLRVCQPRRFIAIDDFSLHRLDSVWGISTQVQFGGQTHEAAYRARFADAIARGQMQIVAADSADGLARLPAGGADVIYLDADHRYEFIMRDLALAHGRVRDDGWLVLNDYVMVPEADAPYCYGVVHAAHEFMLRHDWAMQYLALEPRMFCDVALRPARLVAHAQLAAIHASRSWAITAPLRALMRAVRAA